MKAKILGISCSLRNARRNQGHLQLIDEIKALQSEDELMNYAKNQASEHLQNFIEAGRNKSLPFNEIYSNLRKLKGNKGLSNSEMALVTALWAANQLGAEIAHISLRDYFLEKRNESKILELKNKLIECDGFLISTPVYFGDRGSLSQSLISLFKNDQAFASQMRGKVYGGIATGAKRNGGQETTLIYQLTDIIGCNILGVGNDSDTTSQYGGTCVAGDVGTLPNDSYGIKTSMGTGRRVARIAKMLNANPKKTTLNGKHKVAFWILQDKDDVAMNFVNKLIGQRTDIEARIVNVTQNVIMRCIACDICPTHIDIDENYRCIITSEKDDLSRIHPSFIDCDAVIPVIYSPKNRTGILSNYQRFIERTRYLRRGDYVLGDLLSAPLVIEDVGASENYAVRLSTSMIRHHTILSKPMNAYLIDGKCVNMTEIENQFNYFNELIRKVTVNRILSISSENPEVQYSPVGYVLSVEKEKEDSRLNLRQNMVDNRLDRIKEMIEERLEVKEF